MLEEFVKWFNPEYAEAGRKLLAHMLERIEALEAVVASTPAAPPAKEPQQ